MFCAAGGWVVPLCDPCGGSDGETYNAPLLCVVLRGPPLLETVIIFVEATEQNSHDIQQTVFCMETPPCSQSSVEKEDDNSDDDVLFKFPQRGGEQ